MTSRFKKGLFLLTGIAVLASCSKEDSSESPNGELSQTEVKTVLEADDLSGIADDIVAEAYMDNSSSGKSAKGTTDCYVAVYNENGFTMTFENCNIRNHQNVNGTLNVVYTGQGENASFLVTYDNFSVGNIEFNGTRSFTMEMGPNQNSVAYNVTSNLTITKANGDILEVEGSKGVLLTFGQTLEEITFSITGKWSVNEGENKYSLEVMSPLVGNLACEFLTEGVLQVNKNGLVVSIDWGEGECDDRATLIYPNDVREDFTLRD
ncbi:hypothetical protein [Sediminicola sp. 1XM1-17]|uniref:hypothetical protein n=1 Tax=Sediminicola sp. 1XM1-17 TaxID=3127702 RepID=UPI003076D28D